MAVVDRLQCHHIINYSSKLLLDNDEGKFVLSYSIFCDTSLRTCLHFEQVEKEGHNWKIKKNVSSIYIRALTNNLIVNTKNCSFAV